MKVFNVRFVVALLTAAALGAGCGKSPTSPSLGIPFSTTDLVVGTGTEATNGSTVRVYYRGWIYSVSATDNKGSQFDSNTSGLGFQFTLGTGGVIQGWNQGILGMKVGGKRRIVIPPDLGYGEQGSGPIPSNATLLFEVELLAVAG